MSELLKLRYENDLVVISLNNPPVNLLGRELRKALIAQIKDVQSDPRVKAIVLWAQGRVFSMGNDLKTIGVSDRNPSLSDVCSVIENSEKPVVAAMHGAAMGGGLELALSAHARISTAHCSLGMPEVNMGLVPTAGGSQRLARLCGAKTALKLLLSGKSRAAQTLLDQGVVDRISNDDLWDEAQELAHEIVETPSIPASQIIAGASDPSGYQKAIEDARKTISGPLSKVKMSLCQLVEAAQVLPFSAGLAMEETAYDAVSNGRQFKALSHILFAERANNRPAGKVTAVSSVGIYGDGPQVVMLCREALKSNLTVLACEMSERTYSTISAMVSHDAMLAGKGSETHERIMTRLIKVQHPSDFDDVDLIFDATRATASDLSKRYPIPQDGQLKPLAVLNGSRDPQRLDELMGGHGVVMVVLTPPQGAFEIVISQQTSSKSIGTIQSYASKTGRIAVPVKDAARRVLVQAQSKSVIWMLKHGASIAQIDSAFERFGYASGPFRKMDMGGIVTLQSGLNRKVVDPFWASLIDRMCAGGRVGYASNRGFYDYDDKGKPIGVSTAMVDAVRAERQAVHAPQIEFSLGQIQLRDLAALLSAGCSLVDAKTISHASLADILAVSSLAFPRWRGGPMHASHAHGLLQMQNAIRMFGKDDASIWKDSRSLTEAIKTADGFGQL